MARPRQSEADILEQYRVSLNNAEAHPIISKALAELGYNAEKLGEGKALYSTTRKLYDLNMVEDDQALAAYKLFGNTRNELNILYRTHRKKAKVVFRKDPIMCSRLLISGYFPKAYIKWLEAVKKFYTELSGDETASKALLTLKVLPEELLKANLLIKAVERTRAAYMVEKGESQDATDQKDIAFAKMDDWMHDFYAVARIALEEHPQLIEALGKHA
ncbi:MAG: hypothetical protein LBV41_09600 [Cytophagaceae bacterium]|jgi:hypothetical protein|nr:hypothetical protein [Cytophagaceae bacterium]